MPLIAMLEIVAKVFFVVHSIRSGKDRYWIYVIVFLPGIGCLIYFFSEYLPELQQNQKVKRSRNQKKNLRYLKEQVELLPSVKNKMELAEGCINKGQFTKAIAIYNSCLEDLNEEDPAVVEGLCCAYFFMGDFKSAKNNLLRLREVRGKRIGDEFDLLLARTYEALGDVDRALTEYANLVKVFSGEEARYRYALLLKKLGQTDTAKSYFSEVVKNARLSPNFYQTVQKKWVGMARKHL